MIKQKKKKKEVHAQAFSNLNLAKMSPERTKQVGVGTVERGIVSKHNARTPPQTTTIYIVLSKPGVAGTITSHPCEQLGRGGLLCVETLPVSHSAVRTGW